MALPRVNFFAKLRCVHLVQSLLLSATIVAGCTSHKLKEVDCNSIIVDSFTIDPHLAPTIVRPKPGANALLFYDHGCNCILDFDIDKKTVTDTIALPEALKHTFLDDFCLDDKRMLLFSEDHIPYLFDGDSLRTLATPPHVIISANFLVFPMTFSGDTVELFTCDTVLLNSQARMHDFLRQKHHTRYLIANDSLVRLDAFGTFPELYFDTLYHSTLQLATPYKGSVLFSYQYAPFLYLERYADSKLDSFLLTGNRYKSPLPIDERKMQRISYTSKITARSSQFFNTIVNEQTGHVLRIMVQPAPEGGPIKGAYGFPCTIVVADTNFKMLYEIEFPPKKWCYTLMLPTKHGFALPCYNEDRTFSKFHIFKL